MSYLLQEAIRINRSLSAETRGYKFVVVNSRAEEDGLDDEFEETDFVTVLRLYDREND
jgi:hypothetical protein